MSATLRGLEWLGARAKWMLAAGAVAALLFQDLAAILRPALPWFVGMVFALAMVRIDLPAVARSALRPRRLAVSLSISLAMTALTPAALVFAAQGLGVPAEAWPALVYTYAAPPIASAVGMAFMMGLEATFALEICILTSLLAPFIGPVVVLLLLGEAVPLDALDLAQRLGWIVGGGTLVSMAARALIGAETIARRGRLFDGLGALGMLVFVIPVFDGVTAQITGAPLYALAVLGLAAIPNFGLQIATAWAARSVTDGPTAGSAGLMSGNRNVSLYLAVVPENALFSLYTALYQFPMYFTPLLMRPFLGRASRRRM